MQPVLALQAIPVLAGHVLGRAAGGARGENGTARLAWAQGASRTRWLVAKVVVTAVLLAVAAAESGPGVQLVAAQAGIAVHHRVDLGSVACGGRFFDLHPLPFAGWVTLGLSLGVLLGAADPADRARHGCDARVLRGILGYVGYVLADGLSAAAAPPAVHVQFSAGAGTATASTGGASMAAVPDILSVERRAGRTGGLISEAQVTHHSAAWLARHHIQLWVTYQPGSRYGLFQLIEFGWLIVLAAILITATAVLIRRRAA